MKFHQESRRLMGFFYFHGYFVQHKYFCDYELGLSRRNGVINAVLLSIKKLISRKVINYLLLPLLLFDFYSFAIDSFTTTIHRIYEMFAVKHRTEQKLNSIHEMTDILGDCFLMIKRLFSLHLFNFLFSWSQNLSFPSRSRPPLEAIDE